MRTCPNCGAQVVVLITDNQTQKRFCHHCGGFPPVPGTFPIRRHATEPPSKPYTLEERLKDLEEGSKEPVD
jgi:hypothetical protein